MRPRAVAPRVPRRAALLAALALPTGAGAQGFPNRPVRIVVPFPPGGAADITARLLGEQMAPSLGQAVVIENRPGAGGNIAAEAFARAAPDGHTAFLGGATILCANKHCTAARCPSTRCGTSRTCPAFRSAPRCW